MLKIFYMDISCGCSYEQSQAFYKILPKERQERIDRLHKEEMAQSRMLAGIFMQYGLSRMTGVSIGNICYSYGEQGKPELDWKNIRKTESMPVRKMEDVLMVHGRSVEQLDFSLSHSGKYAVLAVSDKPVGVDVERLRGNRLNVAKRCFHKKEYEDIMALQRKESCDRRFLEYWTMKEAYVKRTGDGLRIPLDSFWIKRGEDGVSSVEEAGGQRVWLATGYIGETYAFSVCSRDWDDIQQLSGQKRYRDRDGKIFLPMEEIAVEQIYGFLNEKQD